MAHIKQSRPDAGPVFQFKVLETSGAVASSSSLSSFLLSSLDLRDTKFYEPRI
jgi:hypothetical protein